MCGKVRLTGLLKGEYSRVCSQAVGDPTCVLAQILLADAGDDQDGADTVVGPVFQDGELAAVAGHDGKAAGVEPLDGFNGGDRNRLAHHPPDRVHRGELNPVAREDLGLVLQKDQIENLSKLVQENKV